MKRASESQERDVTPNREKHARRQDPVSCQFCRTKKLKCDRMTPCSNCRARKRVCVSANEAIHGSVTSQPANIDGSASALALNPSLPNQSIEDLNARVKKIEDLLATTHPGSFTAHRQIERGSNSANTKGESSGDDVELSKTVVWLETDAFDYKPSPSDVHVNVNNYLSPNAQSPDAFASSFLSLITPSIGTSLDQHVIISTLPTRAQGQVLLQYYADHVNWIYHILHIPTVRRKINLVYSALEQNQQPHYGDLSLVATVFALSAYFGYSSTSFQFQGVEAKEYSHRWTSLAQAALSAANFINIPSIETIQAAILISQHLLPNVGAIATFRTLAATAMHSARSLLIHQVDSPANKKRRESNPNVDWVDIETKRRLWWHIASTDWMLSFMSGPQCGTYMIHPKQMNVDYPANVDDEAIGTQPNYHQSVDAPTEMTYFIFRCKISEVFRDIVDSAANAGCELEDLSYDIVLEFDKKLHFLMNDAPLFFKFDPRSRLQSESIDARMPFIAYQRNMGQFGLHTRLSRLHRPYLARGAHDPRYSYSRIVCLRSARVVIELGSQMTASRPNFEPIRVWTIVHHIFVSTVILVMDYCFNREDPQAARRKEEILDCFRLLERSQEESTIARQGLKQLREFLNHRKWKRHAQIAGEPSSPVPQNQALPSMGMQENKNAAIIPVTQPPVQSADPLAAYDFSNQSSEWTNMDDNLLEYLNFDSSLDSSAWDTLFQNVESNNPLY